MVMLLSTGAICGRFKTPRCGGPSAPRTIRSETHAECTLCAMLLLCPPYGTEAGASRTGCAPTNATVALPAGACRQMRRVTVALHVDMCQRCLDLTKVVSAQLDIDGADVLLQARQLGGARNRHDPRLLRQQPRQCDLRRRGALAGGDATEQVDQRLVGRGQVAAPARRLVPAVSRLPPVLPEPTTDLARVCAAGGCTASRSLRSRPALPTLDEANSTSRCWRNR